MGISKKVLFDELKNLFFAFKTNYRSELAYIKTIDFKTCLNGEISDNWLNTADELKLFENKDINNNYSEYIYE